MSVNGKTVQDPLLLDVLLAHKAEVLKTINAVKVGAIVSFDPDTRTAVAQISFRRILEDGTIASYPVLLDCPVVTLQGGGGQLTFPIAAGDECLVLFADQNIDAWYLNGGQQTPLNGRRHDLSDGIILVGLNPLAAPLAEAVVEGETALAAEGAKIGLLGGLATIKNETTSLLTLLQSLITAINAITTTTSGDTVSPASQAALTAISVQLETLLYP